jgi:hypothetical protein
LLLALALGAHGHRERREDGRDAARARVLIAPYRARVMTPQTLCRKLVENRHPKTRMNAALADADWTYAVTIHGLIMDTAALTVRRWVSLRSTHPTAAAAPDCNG